MTNRQDSSKPFPAQLIPSRRRRPAWTGRRRGKQALDPVCGMTVDPATAERRAIRDGRSYWFCSAGCRQKFLSDPADDSPLHVVPGNGDHAQEEHHEHH
ncbi:YHS domain-containing protein [Nakamurella sp. PAMC28650]|uniref:YHS domain-containing protein n=1 Tax=Nakamurella sp. PAMC28650 TaxID=2762325 RepID=UPI00164E0CF7|nr:YHS domain-containing protein [Nakamurella sp. PAMC28650]